MRNNIIKPTVPTALLEKFNRWSLDGLSNVLTSIYLDTYKMKSFTHYAARSKITAFSVDIHDVVSRVGGYRMANLQGPCEFQYGCPPHKWGKGSVAAFAVNTLLLRARNVWNGAELLEAILDGANFEERREVMLAGFDPRLDPELDKLSLPG